MAEDIKPTELKKAAKVEAAPKNSAQLDSDEEPMVKVYAPRAFKFTTETHAVIDVAAGLQSMSASNAKHWWMKANGVQIVN